MRSRTVLNLTLMATCCLLTCAGCGGAGGYDISGKVTFDGKPIPQGKIYFAPDGTKDNKGATGYADIKDGSYNTANPGGKKHVGGPMRVSIEGSDPSQKIEDPVNGEMTIKSLFPGYQTTADLDKKTSTKDFDVPAAAAEQKPSTSEAAPVVP